MMCGSMPTAVANTRLPGCDLAIAGACKAAEVDYDDFTLTVAAGSYPCLPGITSGTARSFDETDLLALYIYGRLVAFGFGALRAGEYACRVHAALRANPHARSVSIALTGAGGKRVVVDRAAPASPANLLEKIEFDVVAIRELLKRRIETDCEE
jgi:hypothetical protein